MAEPIEIIIRKGSGGEGTGFGVPSMKESDYSGRTTKMFTEGLPDKTSGNKATAAATAFALATLKKAIGYSISQYGNQTGNYIAQSDMELTMSYINTGMGITGSIAAGAIAGGAYGAIIAGVIAVGSTAINIGFQAKTLQTNISKLNTYANIMAERSGNINNDNSRGTKY